MNKRHRAALSYVLSDPFYAAAAGARAALLKTAEPLQLGTGRRAAAAVTLAGSTPNSKHQVK